MDTALPQKFPFILDRNLVKANCTGNWVCTSCDTVVLGKRQFQLFLQVEFVYWTFFKCSYFENSSMNANDSVDWERSQYYNAMQVNSV